jgi:hypothetical protein
MADADLPIVWWWLQRNRASTVVQLTNARRMTLLRLLLCIHQYRQLLFMSHIPASVPQPRPTIGSRLNLSTLTANDCLTRFRFTLGEIQRIRRALHLPPQWMSHGLLLQTDLALALLLRRLVWPVRLVDIAVEFGIDHTYCSRIVNDLACHLAEVYQQHFTFWPGVTTARMVLCANAITNAFPAVVDVWGFIDGTTRPIARPIRDQRDHYSGHKRRHQQNYQGVFTPDGLLVSCNGPYFGSRNDINMLDDSKLEQILPSVADRPGRRLMLFGDLIYLHRDYVLTGYRAPMDAEQQQYNTYMASIRVHIERGFGKVTQLFSGTDLKRVQRVLLSPTSAYYQCAVLFTNIHTCMHGQESYVHFGLAPPTMEQYLA